MRLLVQLRWIAVGGQLLAILAVHFGLGAPLPLWPMLAVIASLALANPLIRRISYRRTIGPNAILCALLLDVTALAVQLYLSGGASNPFISLFLLQLVLGAIVLDPLRVAALGGATAACFAILGAFSVPLAYPPDIVPMAPRLEALGAWISFVLTGALLTVFVSRLIRNLRERDAHLAELSQRATEEDALVRMGLLASGAAHELGTPLSSISVILNDWRRMPKLVGDADLATELAEMQSELDRCKAIVSDILHSVGAPRGEEMARIAAADLLEEAAAEWRALHPAIPIAYVREPETETAVVVAEPAVRQVLLSLLENAGEASPSGIGLSGAVREGQLAISILDNGPGFTEAQLASVGKPYQSTKGAGRGLGLFLAAALARRIGGRLTVSNRAGGGAMVRLSAPLAPPRRERTA